MNAPNLHIKRETRTAKPASRRSKCRKRNKIEGVPSSTFRIPRSALLLLSILFLAVSSTFAAPGETAANFLKIGVGARGAAMGDAQVALAHDVSSLHWNPAGLSGMRYKELSVMHYALVEGISYQQLSYGFPTAKGRFAFGINRLDFGDIEAYDDDAIRTGNVDASHLLLTAGWGKEIFEKSELAAGANLKYLKSDLAGFSAGVPMLDLGVRYPFRSEKLRDLSFAAAIRNLGPDIKYDSDTSPLPRQLVIGGAMSALGGNLNVALDFIKPLDAGTYVATGIEYRVFKLINLRAGYNGNSDFVGNNLSYGLGLSFNNWSLDYAFVPFGDLGDTNRVSVNVRFGRAQRLKSAEDQVELAYRSAQRQLALGNGVEAYATVIDLLLIAPWHKPSVELKARIEKQFSDMRTTKNKVEMETQIAETFTKAKSAFDRDDLVAAKKGFTTILALQPDHVGSRVYLDRIQNRYQSLARESFKIGMNYFAAGDYDNAIKLFEKTLSIDEYHEDARAQLARAKELSTDRRKRIEEIRRLAGAADAYKEGLKAYQEKNWELALAKFEEVQRMVPEYEEVGRYYDLTIETWAGILFEEGKVAVENGRFKDAVEKLKKANAMQPDDGRIAAALEVAQRDLEIQNARNSKQLYRDGLEAYLRGDTDRAEALWIQSLELDPSNDDALKAITKLEEMKAAEGEKQ